MDSDFWRTRLAAAKRQFNMQNHHHFSNSQLGLLSSIGLIWTTLRLKRRSDPIILARIVTRSLMWRPLCSHLEDEHSCESKAIVCPICSVKVVGDMLSHITLQHGHLFKISFLIPIPNSQALSLLGRDLREAHLQVLLGGSGYRSNSATSSAATTDNFLSSLVLNFSSEADEISKSVMSSLEESSSRSVASEHIWKSSFHSALSREEREERMRQATGRSVFVQDLLISTLLAE
ncbi:UNVERIFIED_CONTAM: protein dehydration-induced [Sesamum angustifolium]|uniref:Protein dehydration-induced n=1 Tax=Sesamum angustifolium TaxID=2727405 RepID=A0AAW2PCT8_9LAMI